MWYCYCFFFFFFERKLGGERGTTGQFILAVTGREGERERERQRGERGRTITATDPMGNSVHHREDTAQ
jgi:hypothetical protein